MAERAKDSGPEWNGLRTGPVTSLSDALKSIPGGDQFHLLSQPKSDQSSGLDSSHDNDRALGEPETLMALFGENDVFEDAKERWESDRDAPKKWSLATKMTMIALVAIAFAIAIAVPLGIFENNRRSADATAQRIVVPKQTTSASPPGAARQSGETLPAASEQNRPRDSASGLKSVVPSGDPAAGSKSMVAGQNAPPQAPVATQSPAKTIGKEELANGPAPADNKSVVQDQNAPTQAPATAQSPETQTPDRTAADTKPVGQDQDVSPRAPAATQSTQRTNDKEESAKGPTPNRTAADPKPDQNAPPQAQAATQSPQRTNDKEESARAATPNDNATDTKPVGQGQNAPPQQALAATQSPARRVDNEELARGLIQDETAAVNKSIVQAQNAPPQAPAAPQSAERTMDKEQLASLLKRGRYLLSVGDIAPARLLLERAADARDASAAFDLAGTYDPAVLARTHVLGIAPDVAMARMWYEKALSLGLSEAQERLARLQK
jgi:TPR repeat protein